MNALADAPVSPSLPETSRRPLAREHVESDTGNVYRLGDDGGLEAAPLSADGTIFASEFASCYVNPLFSQGEFDRLSQLALAAQAATTAA